MTNAKLTIVQLARFDYFQLFDLGFVKTILAYVRPDDALFLKINLVVVEVVIGVTLVFEAV